MWASYLGTMYEMLCVLFWLFYHFSTDQIYVVANKYNRFLAN